MALSPPARDAGSRDWVLQEGRFTSDSEVLWRVEKVLPGLAPRPPDGLPRWQHGSRPVAAAGAVEVAVWITFFERGERLSQTSAEQAHVQYLFANKQVYRQHYKPALCTCSDP